MKFLSSVLLVVALLSLSGVVQVQAQAAAREDCDQCQFDGLDATDCKDYGLIDNEELVAWMMASDECLDEFQVAISGTDPTTVCANVGAFVNGLRFGGVPDTSKLGLGVGEGGFYLDGPVLKDSITVNGATIDCEASEGDCYNGMRDYFETAEGQAEIDQVCNTLRARVLNDKQLEQSTIRNRLCRESADGVTIPASCEPLWSQQLQGKIADNPTKNCAAFGTGIQNRVIEGCEGIAGGPIGGGVDADEDGDGTIPAATDDLFTDLFSGAAGTGSFFLSGAATSATCLMMTLVAFFL